MMTREQRRLAVLEDAKAAWVWEDGTAALAHLEEDGLYTISCYDRDWRRYVSYDDLPNLVESYSIKELRSARPVSLDSLRRKG